MIFLCCTCPLTGSAFHGTSGESPDEVLLCEDEEDDERYEDDVDGSRQLSPLSAENSRESDDA